MAINRDAIISQIETWELEGFTDFTIDELADEVIWYMTNQNMNQVAALNYVSRKCADGNCSH